jgi:hypothetical protein
MINEELVSKSAEVGFRISNLTLDLILKGLDALIKGLEKKDEKPLDVGKDAPKEPELKSGKQTLKQLHKHNEGLAAIELKDPNLRELQKSMKKADIDFSCVKDGKGSYTLFFKGKNAEEMTSAFKKYTEKMVVRADIQAGKKTVRDDKQAKRTAAREEKQSIRAELKEAKAAAKALDKGKSKVKNKSKGAIDI